MGRHLPCDPGHGVLPPQGHLAQCGGRAYEGQQSDINFRQVIFLLFFQFLVRNARGKIIEEAEEKRDALIVTFKVFKFVPTLSGLTL